MAEIRHIISTPAVNQPGVYMSQQEQVTDESEVTITAIIEELNKSTSSRGDSSTQEDPQ